MKYGFTLPGRGLLATPDNLATIARRGEELGYHFVLFGDHIVVPRHIASPIGNADEIAADIRRYAAMGVGSLVLDLARLSHNLDDMLQHMEALATQVWPQV